MSIPSSNDGRLKESRFVLALDYGTSHTGVAWAKYDKRGSSSLQEINLVTRWGEAGGNTGICSKIPSVISYAPSKDKKQWGASIDEEGTAMWNTKLELDHEASTLDELDLLLRVLHKMNNLDISKVKSSRDDEDLPWKAPVDILTNYLSRVFQCLLENDDFPSKEMQNICVDIVLTVPAQWSYRPKMSLYQAARAGALNNAFLKLGDIMMIRDIDAAAVHALENVSLRSDQHHLKLGECFVVCDAGSGKASFAAYKISSLKPLVRLEKMTHPCSAKCGSVHLGGAFEKWLEHILGHNRFKQLRGNTQGPGVQSSQMRVLHTAFEEYRRGFGNEWVDDMLIQLPSPYNTLTIKEGDVKDGSARLTCNNMKKIFDPVVNKIIECILDQITKVEEKHHRVKKILLVGGLSGTPFLQEELRKSFPVLRDIKLIVPNDAWTAAAQGAVTMGMEKEVYPKNISYATGSLKSFGIVLKGHYLGARNKYHKDFHPSIGYTTDAKDRLNWLIRRGDLILSDQAGEAVRSQMISFAFRESDPRKKEVPIWEYSEDDYPEYYGNVMNELFQVALLSCDFSKIPLQQFDRVVGKNDRRVHYVAHCVCNMITTRSELNIEVVWNTWHSRVIAQKRVMYSREWPGWTVSVS